MRANYIKFSDIIDDLAVEHNLKIISGKLILWNFVEAYVNDDVVVSKKGEKVVLITDDELALKTKLSIKYVRQMISAGRKIGLIGRGIYGLDLDGITIEKTRKGRERIGFVVNIEPVKGCIE